RASSCSTARLTSGNGWTGNALMSRAKITRERNHDQYQDDADDDHRARDGAGRTGERDRAAAGRIRPRPLAAAEQLGPLGGAVRGGRVNSAPVGLGGRL